MKIQNNYTNTAFNAGLTASMKSQISSCKPRKIEKVFEKEGISANFKNNKIVAWSSLKCLEFIKSLNKNYGLNLCLPRGVFVEDFNNLNVNVNAHGLCNTLPTFLHKGCESITPEKTVIFNEHKDYNYEGGNDFWDNLDDTTSFYYEKKYSPTDFFLEIFLHEFGHAAHMGNLINLLGGQKYFDTVIASIKDEAREAFTTKYRELLERICLFATENPFEAVAYDLTSREIANMDKNTLLPTSNFIKTSPYQNRDISDIFVKEDVFNNSLHEFWKGNFK